MPPFAVERQRIAIAAKPILDSYLSQRKVDAKADKERAPCYPVRSGKTVEKLCKSDGSDVLLPITTKLVLSLSLVHRLVVATLSDLPQTPASIVPCLTRLCIPHFLKPRAVQKKLQKRISKSSGRWSWRGEPTLWLSLKVSCLSYSVVAL